MKKRILAALVAVLLTLLSLGSALPVLAKTEKPVVKYETPAGYNDHDYRLLVAYLETEDENGVKNGEKLSGNYDPADPETWEWVEHFEYDGEEWDEISGVFWEEYDGEKQVYEYAVYALNLVGPLVLSDCRRLDTVFCLEDDLTEIDLSGCCSLTRLYCDYNELTELDLSDCVMLRELSCASNELTSLDVSANTELESLCCPDNRLTELDLHSNSKLISLCCQNNELARLDLSDNPLITDIECEDNRLTELDVSGLASLSWLNCSDNELSELDVSQCRWLEFLQCDGNRLAELDLTCNPGIPFDMLLAEGDGSIGLCMGYIWDEDEINYTIAAARPDEGASFLGWYSEEGELLSSEAELSEYDTGCTRIVARFSEAAVITGDCDGSGIVDTADALLVLRCALGISGSAEQMLASCDMDGNGIINTTDSLLILRLALGIG